MAPAGARNCFCTVYVRLLRGVLRLGGVKDHLVAIEAVAACVRFEIRRLSATCCTRHL